jgi:hypothetical protein
MPGIVENQYIWRIYGVVLTPKILANTVFFAELIDASAGIDDLLLTGIKRVARGAHFNAEILAEGRACGELVATTTGDFKVVVIGMDVGFHFLALPSGLLHKKGA